MGAFILSVIVVVPVAIWVERWFRRRYRETRTAIDSAVHSWSEANGGGPLMPESDTPRALRQDGSLTASAEAEVRGRSVRLLWWESTGYGGETYTGTRCVVPLSSRYPPLHVVPRAFRRRSMGKPADEAAFDRLFKVRDGSERPVPTVTRRVLAELRTSGAVRPKVRLVVADGGVMLSTDPQIDGRHAVDALAEAAVAIAEDLDAHAPAVGDRRRHRGDPGRAAPGGGRRVRRGLWRGRRHAVRFG